MEWRILKATFKRNLIINLRAYCSGLLISKRVNEFCAALCACWVESL